VIDSSKLRRGTPVAKCTTKHRFGGSLPTELPQLLKSSLMLD
jgi:hypothetical protein